MKISQKQILAMYQVLVESLNISKNIAFSWQTRMELARDILDQQDDEIKDILDPK